MRRNRRTKLIATLGPASEDLAIVRQLFQAGVDVFRINMSHSSHAVLAQRVQQIRAIEAEFNRPIGILADLQGPKLRVGTFAAPPVMLEKGQRFVLDSDPAPGDATRVHLPHPEILAALRPGHRVLIDDGKLLFVVREADPERVEIEVEVAGAISNKKGVSLPDTLLPSSALTDKDRSDLVAALEAGVDWIALSFVQRPDDVAEVRKIARGRALVMSKLEKPQAIERLDEIMELSDALMVARGDLGVEMPLEVVPGLQKRITRMARKLGKPVVIATQMLESMIQSPTPTRAEVSDVATAVFEGADAVMLSAESAAGKYPITAVETMSRIAEAVERDPNYTVLLAGQRTAPEPTGADAIAAAARSVAETLDLRAIVAWTASGATALRIARERPYPPILTLTTSHHTARRLALVWGVHAVVGEDPRDVDDMARLGAQVAREQEFANPGQRVILVAGVPFGTPGATNMLRIAFVGAGDRPPG
ncbi:pyruvate kinase [Rhabdaerophilum calidifontis]|uniref:pyruvate kinase n=1 Tax=Rhabdaerophilum calidifontis TaxID=2604328 RepID=UPI001238CDE0|nr:pyruvate kinase [Rhabdaerophilum calidifontis]